MGTLSVGGFLGRSGVQSGDRELNQSGVLWDLYLLRYRLGARLEDRA